jgi:Cu+-exporting ATPase
MTIDPVCGMTVDEKSASGNTFHAGKTWYFCSVHCQHEFEANPSMYAGSVEVPSEAAHDHDHDR